ncbi:mannosyltransferase [Nocardia tengchongensis]|uniref:mannosyltransferase n=1 Tax=Nocardia tengchongensis TaxID=2055889 RepID=UPI001FE3D942|nr:mannosyltransferase [Nocardia tengchongensis]
MNRRFQLAAAALGISVLARVAWALFWPSNLILVDLHVYVEGAANLFHGNLYEWTDSSRSPQFPLPFTYPPFAALLLYPLHFLPFGVVAVGWLLATVAALFGIVWIALEMIVGPTAMQEQRWRTAAVAWTAGGMWLEPVRSTLDYGQVNVFLVFMAMAAARSSRWWLAGAWVGLGAGIKLTPAVTGLYFVARRQWLAIAASVGAFLATIGLTYLLAPNETKKYFGELIGDPKRIGPVGSVINQSLRGALSRLAGHDIGGGLLWKSAVLVTAVLAFFAWRALASDDRLGTLLIVQLFGLLAAPISWSHHWICLVPLVLWLRYGPLREAAGARLMYAYWMFNTIVGIAWFLGTVQTNMWEISRPGYLAWAGAANALGVLALFAWIIAVKRFSPVPVADRSPVREPYPVA